MIDCYHDLGEDVPPLQLKEGVFRCIMQLFDCLLTEVHERCKKGLSLAKRLNSTLAFFCYDLLSIIEPRQVFELVSRNNEAIESLCSLPGVSLFSLCFQILIMCPQSCKSGLLRHNLQKFLCTMMLIWL